MAREIVNRLVAAAHVAGDGSALAQEGFGSIVRTGMGTYEFTADGIQKEVFAFGESVIHVTARGLFTIAVSETVFPGGPIEVQILSADGKSLTDGEFDIIIINAIGVFF